MSEPCRTWLCKVRLIKRGKDQGGTGIGSGHGFLGSFLKQGEQKL